MTEKRLQWLVSTPRGIITALTVFIVLALWIPGFIEWRTAALIITIPIYIWHHMFCYIMANSKPESRVGIRRGDSHIEH